MASRSFDSLSSLLTATKSSCASSIRTATTAVIRALRRQNKVILCGNGGSAADAQHIAAELVGKFHRQRRALPAIALTTDTSILTSIGNDTSFEQVFARQVEALGKREDVLVCISTSGRSRNVIAAARAARRLHMRVIALLGRNKSRFSAHSDVVICVPSTDTPRIQEAHTLIGHIICQAVEDALG
jgi:D-sedoheptulose 7-phosphate isomerase